MTSQQTQAGPRQLQLSPLHQAFLDRFVAACRADARIVAALLGGSYVRGAADAYSDLDLSVFASDAAFDDLYAGRAAFIRTLGELVFLEDFGIPHIAFFILSDGTEGELWFGSPARREHLGCGAYQVLVDKQGLLAGARFDERVADADEQRQTLRQLITWFWHELSHFITAIGRGQLWWAHGQLDALRCNCMNLARLRQNFLDPDVGGEPYFKIERALSADQLAPLAATYAPLERGALLRAGLAAVGCYRQLAQELAQMQGIAYPAGLERVMLGRLERLSEASTGFESPVRP